MSLQPFPSHGFIKYSIPQPPGRQSVEVVSVLHFQTTFCCGFLRIADILVRSYLQYYPYDFSQQRVSLHPNLHILPNENIKVFFTKAMKIMPGFAVFLLQILTNMPPLTNVPHLPSVRCFSLVFLPLLWFCACVFQSWRVLFSQVLPFEIPPHIPNVSFRKQLCQDATAWTRWSRIIPSLKASASLRFSFLFPGCYLR